MADRPVNKAKNDVRRTKGKAKQAVGRVTGDDELRARGTAEEVIADLRELGEKVRSVAKDGGEKAGGAVRAARKMAGETADKAVRKVKSVRP